MKRELKVSTKKTLWAWRLERCSPNPYEEGTERYFGLFMKCRFPLAAAQIPMKRELKVGIGREMERDVTVLQPKSL